jgi:hypothetical protein
MDEAVEGAADWGTGACELTAADNCEGIEDNQVLSRL